MEEKTGYQEVQKLLLEDVRANLSLENAAKDERAMARKLAEYRGIDPDFADDLATVLDNIDKYDSKEEAMREISFGEY